MKLTREAIQRMISQKQGTSNVTVINQGGGGGGGGVTLGPLLTSLNAEAMPSAEGYLHWTGSAWAFDTPTGGDPVDLTPYALKTWVQTNYASKDDIADFITLSEAEDVFAAIDHSHNNYLPLTAGANKALTGSLYITGSNGIQWAGSPGVGMLCYMPSSGWTGISASQWGVGAPSAQGVIRSNANDILHYRNGTNYKIWDAYNFTPSDYLPLTGGTVESLTVTNGLDADSITVGSLVNSDTLAEYLDQDASDARYLQLTGGTMSGNLVMNGASVTFGQSGNLASIGYYSNALQIGAGTVAVMSDGVFTFNGDQVATQPWVENLYMKKSDKAGLFTQFANYDGAVQITIGGTQKSLTIAYANAAGSANTAVNADKLDNHHATDFALASALGNYLPLTGGTMAGPLNMGSYMLSFGTTAAIYYASGLAGNILVVNADNVDIMTAGGNFRWNSQKVATQPWVQQQGYITQTAADGRYIKGVSVYGSSLTPDSNRVVNVPYADINTAGVIQIGTGLVNDNEGHTTVDTSVIASRSWANGQFVTVIGVNGENLTYTKNGSTTNLTVRFAMRTMGFKRMYVTGSQIADANTMTVGGVEYALLSNYASTDLWANMPSGMSYGNVLQLTSASSLSGQLAWDSNDNVTTGVTRKLYWRSRNSTGWGTDDWHTIAFQDWVQSWVNGRGFASAQDLYDLGTLVTTGYLPLTAGSGKPLTGSLYVTPGAGTHQTVEIDGSQYKIGLTIGAGNVNRGMYGYTVGGSNDWLLYFDASNTILNYGNVGIGTASPSYKLDVNGDIHTSGDIRLDSEHAICFKDNANPSRWCDALSHSYDSDLGKDILYVGLNFSRANHATEIYGRTLTLYAGTGSKKFLKIIENGNVGIGIDAPDYKLDVSGVIRATDGIMVRSGSSDAIGFDTTGILFNKAQEGGSPITASIFAFTWDNDAQNVIVSKNGNMTVTGKLAVGTTTFDGSNAKLQVGGNMFATGSITSKSNAGNVSLGNGNISATNLYISTVVFGNSNNDPAIYIGNGHVYARNSQGQTTMIV